MMPGVDVDITIRDSVTGSYVRIPVVPETLEYGEGDALTDSVKILNLGNVEFPSGVDLDTLSWSSFFPARYDPGYCATSDLKTPQEYRDQLKAWKEASTKLQIVCPAVGLNISMRLQSLPWTFSGFEGDIGYQVSFKQVKTVAPRKISTATASIMSVSSKTQQDRPPAPAPAQAKTYVVKAGDCLSLIAKNNGYSDWHTIYDANRSVIGDNPNLIYAGQVLTLP